jgi:hypothetical protein
MLTLNEKRSETMKSRTKANCEWLVAHLNKQGWVKEVPVKEVRYEIAEHIGGDDRTVNKYLHKLAEYGLMRLKNPVIMEFLDLDEEFRPLHRRQSLIKYLPFNDDGEEEPP